MIDIFYRKEEKKNEIKIGWNIFQHFYDHRNDTLTNHKNQYVSKLKGEKNYYYYLSVVFENLNTYQIKLYYLASFNYISNIKKKNSLVPNIFNFS